MPSHYLNQCWNIVNLTLRNKRQWTIDRNSYIFIQENAFEYVICEMSAISSQSQCINNSLTRALQLIFSRHLEIEKDSQAIQFLNTASMCTNMSVHGNLYRWLSYVILMLKYNICKYPSCEELNTLVKDYFKEKLGQGTSNVLWGGGWKGMILFCGTSFILFSPEWKLLLQHISLKSRWNTKKCQIQFTPGVVKAWYFFVLILLHF